MEYLRVLLFCTVTSCILLSIDSKTVELFGAGASFPSVVYSHWINLYRQERIKHVGVYMTYDSIGSGAGKARIKGEKLPHVHYAGSDSRLTKEEEDVYPDLNLFPTLAGAIGMAYNIPGVHHLNLNLEIVVGIYNGTITSWNDPLIAMLNPETTLPMKDILVVARSDKSGTTWVFTSGLSAYSEDWRSTYGIFSVGRDIDTRLPVKWKNDAVKLFGHTNQGMSGLILSVDYSLGYVAVANVHSSEMHYATMQNRAGNLVNATVETVQNAIISANGSYDIMNTPGKFAYPLVSFTYFIVKMSTMEDCNSAVELVRYVRWIYSSVNAHDEAIILNMVPIDPASAASVDDKILKTMTCGGRNVWEMVLEQIQEENKKDKPNEWQIPTFLSLCLLIAAATGLSVHLGRRQILLHRELLKDTWKIDGSYISLEYPDDKKSDESNSRCSSVRDTLNGGMVFSDNSRTDQQLLIGVFMENPVTLYKMQRQPCEFTLAEKKMLIHMRDNIKHAHVMQFLGLTRLNGKWSSVHLESTRGSLSDVLQSKTIAINTDGIIALTKSLVQGLLYLHKKCIVHGNLTGMCCLIDIAWELKIADWVESKFDTYQRSDRNQVSSISDAHDECNKRLLWTAPEVIKFKRKPNQATDVYSLCMVFQEMFTGHEPYKELSKPEEDVVTAVLTCGIRPQIVRETPAVFREIMEKSWEVDPAARPRLDVILNSIKAAFPANHSFLDCIIRSVELYARQLEERVKEQETERDHLKEKTQACMYHSVPKTVAEILKAKSKVEAELQDNLCILVSRIANMESIIKHITPKGIVNLLNSFYASMDQLLAQHDIYRLNRHAGQNVFVVGLQRSDGYREEEMVVAEALKIALKLNAFTETFTKENLNGIDTEIKIQTGLASGSVILGILGSVVPQYCALGIVVEEATDLAMNAKPGEIQLSNRVKSLLK